MATVASSPHRPGLRGASWSRMPDAVGSIAVAIEPEVNLEAPEPENPSSIQEVSDTGMISES